MKFERHSSPELVELYHKRPYQGQTPEKASIIFLSSDANYSPKITNHPFFQYILEYQRDGVSFWRKYDCHHPFLLPDYPFDKTRDGVPFHRNFEKLGLGTEHAEHISFMELLDVPTIGSKSEDRRLYYKFLFSSLSHLEYLDQLIFGGGRKLFFVSRGVLADISVIRKAYPKLFRFDCTMRKGRKIVVPMNDNVIHCIYHFSSAQIHSQLKDIKLKIDRWLEERVVSSDNKCANQSIETTSKR